MGSGISSEAIGGVTYSKGLVVESHVKKDNTGNNRYYVTLKSGVQINYTEQDNVFVKGYEHGLFSKHPHLMVSGMNGANIIGSESNDAISLDNCSNMVVDISNNPRDLFGGDNISVTARNDNKQNIKIIKNKEDNIKASRVSDNKNIKEIEPDGHFDSKLGNFVYEI